VPLKYTSHEKTSDLKTTVVKGESAFNLEMTGKGELPKSTGRRPPVAGVPGGPGGAAWRNRPGGPPGPPRAGPPRTPPEDRLTKTGSPFPSSGLFVGGPACFSAGPPLFKHRNGRRR